MTGKSFNVALVRILLTINYQAALRTGTQASERYRTTWLIDSLSFPTTWANNPRHIILTWHFEASGAIPTKKTMPELVCVAPSKVMNGKQKRKTTSDARATNHWGPTSDVRPSSIWPSIVIYYYNRREILAFSMNGINDGFAQMVLHNC
jgi:hypothetical protein